MEAEYNAVTCVAVYMLLMSFSQKGIDKLRNFQEHMKMRHPDGDFVVSEGFDDGMSITSSLRMFICNVVFRLALNWFKEHFIKCNDRAALVKTWLPVTYDGPKSWLDQLVYDRALVLVSSASLNASPQPLNITNRVGQQHAKNSSIRCRRRTSARSYTRSLYGVYTLSKIIYCKPGTLSWMRIGKRSRHVRFF